MTVMRGERIMGQVLAKSNFQREVWSMDHGTVCVKRWSTEQPRE
jgi:hypothetical protein